MTDVAEELRAYAARRMGGTSPRAQQLVGRAATLYGQTLRLLQRHGGSSAKFWESLDMLSMSFDDIMNSFPGDADYYLGPRQFDELVLPALRAMAPGVARRPLPQQLTVVGDLVIHTHCEALSAAQQRDGVAQLCRVVAAAKHDPESRPHYTTMRFCLVTAVAKLLFMSTAREQQPPHASDLDREYDGALAAAAARGGMLKAALLLLADTRSMALAMGVVPEMVAASEALSVGVPELEENNLHILDAAAKFAGALVEVGETPAAAALGKWAAGKPAVVSMLLQKLRLPPVEPRCYPVIARTVLLVSRLAAVAPALRAALNAAGLRQALERLRSAWSVAGYTVDSEAAGRCLQALCSDALDGQGAAAQPGLGQQARQARQQNGSAAAPTREQLAALPVRELRARLQAAGLDTTGCAEKRELVDLLLQAGGGGGASGSGGDGNGGGPGSSTAMQQQQGGGTAGEAGEAGVPAPPAVMRRCHHCGATKAPGVKLKLCAGCMHVYFCSADCQKAGWREHKAACKAAGKAAAGQP